MAEMVSIPSKKPVEAYLTKPEGEPKGAVIVIHEVWGLDDHIKSIPDRFAKQGFVALAPEFLGETLDLEEIRTMKFDLFNPEKRNEVQPKLREHMTPMQNPEFGEFTINRLKDCFNYLYDMPEVKQNVIVIGFCFGGTYSFHLAVNEPRLKLALPFYGHADQGADELKKINCPVRAFYGENDQQLVDGLNDLKQRMQEANVDFNDKVYPNCGHAFFNDSNPFAYNKEAAEDAWQIVLAEIDKVKV